MGHESDSCPGCGQLIADHDLEIPCTGNFANAWAGRRSLSDPPHPSEPLELDLKQLLVGDITRLRFIKRYSTSLVLHNENVAEHSYYVGLYSLLVARWVQRNTSTILNMEKLLIRALVHDIDECRSGDIIRTFKYSDPLLRESLHNAARMEFSSVMQDILGNNSEVMKLQDDWESAKNDTPEGSILAFADFLSIVSYLWQEVTCQNSTMADHYSTTKAYMHTFKDIKYDFVRPLIEEVEEIITKIFNRINHDLTF